MTGAPELGGRDADVSDADVSDAHVSATGGEGTAGTPATASGITRTLAVLGGLVLVALAVLVTGGFALAAFLGMGAAALLRRARARPYTPFLGWGSAVVAAALALLAVMVLGFASLPRGAVEQIQQNAAVAARRPRHPDVVQRTVERVYPGSAALSKAQTEALGNAMANSPGVFWGTLVFGGAIGASMFGAFAGSVAWGSASVLLFGVLGRWPGPARRRHAAAHEHVFTPPVHDAFDDIR